MCGRFTLSTPPPAIADHFGLAEVPELEARFNVAPGQSIATVSVSDIFATFLSLFAPRLRERLRRIQLGYGFPGLPMSIWRNDSLAAFFFRFLLDLAGQSTPGRDELRLEFRPR